MTLIAPLCSSMASPTCTFLRHWEYTHKGAIIWARTIHISSLLVSIVTAPLVSNIHFANRNKKCSISTPIHSYQVLVTNVFKVWVQSFSCSSSFDVLNLLNIFLSFVKLFNLQNFLKRSKLICLIWDALRLTHAKLLSEASSMKLANKLDNWFAFGLLSKILILYS